MKRFLLLALCALFAIHSAEARTLYVNAKRPNNKGNGRSLKAAKKTIQAAINIAKKGDTILVYPGEYSPIKTNNKKITIKSVKGQKKATLSGQVWGNAAAVAKLGKVLMTYEYVTTEGPYGSGDDEWKPRKVARYSVKGTATTLVGFTIAEIVFESDTSYFPGVLGGTVKNSTIRGVGKSEGRDSWAMAAGNAKLENCLVKNMYCVTGGKLFVGCTLQRSKIQNNSYEYWNKSWDGPMIASSKFYNCLFVNNSVSNVGCFTNSVFFNCTIADNYADIRHYSYEEENGSENLRLFEKSKFYNCILRDNYSCESFIGGYWDDGTEKWVESTQYGEPKIHNVDLDGNSTYSRTFTDNRDPKFKSAGDCDYRLKKGSPCINKGKLTKAQKKLVGTKDLAGKKRIRGKAIDMGCYEY